MQTSELKWCSFSSGVPLEGFPSAFADSFIETNHLVPDKDSEIGDSTDIGNGYQEIQHVPLDSNTFQMLPKTGAREMNSHERDSAISRYKEKKKTRR